MPNADKKHHLICVSGVRSTPKWTLGARAGDGLNVLGTPDPGPGSYGRGASAVRDNIGFGFGSGQRSNLGQNCDKSVPGAGLYNPQAIGGGPSNKPRGGRWGPPPRRPESSNVRRVTPPGPGSYDLKPTLGQKATKLGPAVYERKGKEGSGTGSIGPGQYCPMARPSSAPPAWSFGTSQRPHPGRNANIDPKVPGLDCVKDTSSGMRTNKGASMKFRNSENDGLRWELRPEPATYATASTLGTKALSFGRAERPSSAPSRPSNVGPGSYDFGSTLKTNGTSGFTNSQRGNLSQCDNETGPGQYDVPSTVSLDKGFDMTRGPRSKAECGDPDVPGPGYYAHTGVKGRTPKWSINRSNQQPREKATEQKPGPTTYGCQDSRGGLVCSIGQGLRPPLQGTDTAKPGPGAYSPSPSLGQPGGKAPTQKGRWKDPVVREVAPTPQTYEADYTSFGY